MLDAGPKRSFDLLEGLPEPWIEENFFQEMEELENAQDPLFGVTENQEPDLTGEIDIDSPLNPFTFLGFIYKNIKII